MIFHARISKSSILGNRYACSTVARMEHSGIRGGCLAGISRISACGLHPGCLLLRPGWCVTPRERRDEGKGGVVPRWCRLRRHLPDAPQSGLSGLRKRGCNGRISLPTPQVPVGPISAAHRAIPAKQEQSASGNSREAGTKRIGQILLVTPVPRRRPGGRRRSRVAPGVAPRPGPLGRRSAPGGASRRGSGVTRASFPGDAGPPASPVAGDAPASRRNGWCVI